MTKRDNHQTASEGTTKDPDGAVFRVLLDGRHILTKPSRHEAERAIHGFLQEWDGEFAIKAVVLKRE